MLEVEAGSKAQLAGLKRGDFIVEAGNRPVASRKVLLDAVAAGKKKGKLVLRVRRGEEVFFAAVRFG
ncbi:MAG: PDZ domain-containing protein [Fibrobacteria bacterium]